MIKQRCASLIDGLSSRFKTLAATVVLSLMGICLLVACAQVPTSTPAPMPTSTQSVVPEATSILTATAPASSPVRIPALDANRMPIFISTDMAGDDHVALLYLLSHPDIQVLGIGSSVGVAHVELGARNILRLLAVVGKEDIPVAVGKANPLEGDHAFPSSWRSGTSRPFGSSVPQAEAELAPESTAELLAKVVNVYPGQVTVVILGAHTDVALALRDDPGLAKCIKDIYIMGGAVYAPGNIHKEYSAIENETAEWNLWVDYVAAAEVFGAGIPLSMVPLDATDQVKVTGEYYEEFVSRAQSAAAQTVAQFWKRSAGSGSGFYIWDVVAVVAMTLPEVAEWDSLDIELVTYDPGNLGQTRPRGSQSPNARVCLEVDAPRLLEELISVLNE
ncbi:MAG: nucleoside hydrolase [Anaerolineae bacterium]|nr:nucleoside hydrolase [Anaerolineae bacterium]